MRNRATSSAAAWAALLGYILPRRLRGKACLNCGVDFVGKHDFCSANCKHEYHEVPAHKRMKR